MYGIDGGTDSIEFGGYICYGRSLLTDCKIEVGIFMINWLFYQGRSETRNVFDGRIVCVAERA